LLFTSARLPKAPPPVFGLAPAGDLRESGDSGERPSGDVAALGVPVPVPPPPKEEPLAVFTGRSGGDAAAASFGGIALGGKAGAAPGAGAPPGCDAALLLAAQRRLGFGTTLSWT
jgi:hypothetical protein